MRSPRSKIEGAPTRGEERNTTPTAKEPTSPPGRSQHGLIGRGSGRRDQRRGATAGGNLAPWREERPPSLPGKGEPIPPLHAGKSEKRQEQTLTVAHPTWVGEGMAPRGENTKGEARPSRPSSIPPRPRPLHEGRDQQQTRTSTKPNNDDNRLKQ